MSPMSRDTPAVSTRLTRCFWAQPLARSQSLKDMKLVYSERRGYHMTVPAADRDVITEANGFIRITSQARRTVACSTDQMAQLSTRAVDMIGQILLATEAQLSKLREEITSQLHVLFRLGEAVALLDTLASFATFAHQSGASYVRPKMAVGGPLALKQSRHPLLEALAEREVVANNVAISHASNFQLITGPNCAGKSTYLRQAALVVLMAHVGIHVPADYATIPVLDRIFTRVGSSDALETSMSTFACEMRECSYILAYLRSHPHANSLVLVDELGRGTSNRDGNSLACAISERLLLHPTTFTLFATHYLQLASLRNLYPSQCVPHAQPASLASQPDEPAVCARMREAPLAQPRTLGRLALRSVRNLVIDAQHSGTDLSYPHRVRDGVASKRNYMTDLLAQMAGVPASVCALARELSAGHDFDPVDTPSVEAKTLEAYAVLAEKLVWLSRSSLDEESKRAYVFELKSKIEYKIASFEAAAAIATVAPHSGEKRGRDPEGGHVEPKRPREAATVMADRRRQPPTPQRGSAPPTEAHGHPQRGLALLSEHRLNMRAVHHLPAFGSTLALEKAPSAPATEAMAHTRARCSMGSAHVAGTLSEHACVETPAGSVGEPTARVEVPAPAPLEEPATRAQQPSALASADDRLLARASSTRRKRPDTDDKETSPTGSPKRIRVVQVSTHHEPRPLATAMSIHLGIAPIHTTATATPTTSLTPEPSPAAEVSPAAAPACAESPPTWSARAACDEPATGSTVPPTIEGDGEAAAALMAMFCSS